MQVKLKYLIEDVDRHGNVRIYFRRRGFKKVRIRETVGTPDFMKVYEQLLSDSDTGAAVKNDSSFGAAPDTWRALCTDYLGSTTFRALGLSTQSVRRRILEATCDEPLEPDSEFTFGQMPVSRFGTKAVKVLRDRKADLPEAANGRIKAISAVFRWAIEDERPKIHANPTRDVRRLKSNGDGWHTWTIEEASQFEKFHPIGSRARLAFALLLLTGVRRSDVVRLGPDLRRGERFVFQSHKGGISLDIPILPELQKIIDATHTGESVYLITKLGQPFSIEGFGNWFRKRCVEASLSNCSAHGLRKAGSTRAAENGATPHQLMAMFGWTTLKQAEAYTRSAARKQLATEGMPLIVRK